MFMRFTKPATAYSIGDNAMERIISASRFGKTIRKCCVNGYVEFPPEIVKDIGNEVGT